MAVCTFEGCVARSHARGLCNSHYAQTKRGETLAPIKHRPSAAAWLRAHISYGGGECLIWPFYRGKNGYAQMKGGWAYRTMCELAHGAPPTSKHEAAHSCGKGHLGCVHPGHLRWATSKENKADMLIHGTRIMGERHFAARLTTEQVLAIRAMATTSSAAELADSFGISRNYVYDLVAGKHWGHV